MRQIALAGRYVRWSLSIFLVVALAACSVSLISAYDDIFDKSAADTQKKVSLLMEQLQREGSAARQYSNSVKAYTDIDADLHFLLVRAEANSSSGPNSETVTIVQTIQQNMALVEEQHRRKPSGPSMAFLQSAQQQLDLQFVALIQLELAKKR